MLSICSIEIDETVSDYSLWHMDVLLTFATLTPDSPLRKNAVQPRLVLCAPSFAFSGSERTIVESSAVLIYRGKKRTDGNSRFK